MMGSDGQQEERTFLPDQRAKRIVFCILFLLWIVIVGAILYNLTIIRRDIIFIFLMLCIITITTYNYYRKVNIKIKYDCIIYRGIFQKKTLKIQNIDSATLSSARGVLMLKIEAKSNFLIITSNTFSSNQLHEMQKFVQARGKMLSKKIIIENNLSNEQQISIIIISYFIKIIFILLVAIYLVYRNTYVVNIK